MSLSSLGTLVGGVLFLLALILIGVGCLRQQTTVDDLSRFAFGVDVDIK